MEDDEQVYAGIRTVLRDFIGRTIVEITQHDKDEFEESGKSYVVLMFNNGNTLKFYVGEDGFDIEDSLPEDAG